MKLLNKIKRVFSEPAYVISAPKIEIYGKRELVMTGCTHIDEFAPDKIILSCHYMSVTVEGAALELLLLAKNTVAVRGNIDSIELPAKKEL